MNYLIYITAFILGIIIGRITKKPDVIDLTPIPPPPQPKEMIRVLKKAEPTTYQQKRLTAIKKNKPIIKTFHK